MPTAYLNGELLPLEHAQVSVMDRGFLFGDGVYEVIPVYGGHLLRLDQHLERLSQSLEGTRIACPLQKKDWENIFRKLIDANGPTSDWSIYLQVTRGVQSPRDHAFPSSSKPTVFVMCSPLSPPPADQYARAGVAAITLDDIRWQYCHLKTVNLLPNVLLRQQAIDENAKEAILIRNGYATEGAASNLFIVIEDTLVTPPKSPKLLPGVTRDLVLELAQENAIAYRETDIPAESLLAAQEIWLTSSTKEIVPVTQLDGRAVGQASQTGPGPMWRRMVEIYQSYKDELRQGRRT